MPNLRFSFVLALALPLAAQDTRHPALDLNLDGAIPWIRDPEVLVDKRHYSFGLATKIDRTELLDQAIARAKEQNKPILWYVPRIVENQNLHGQQMYRAPVARLALADRHVEVVDLSAIGPDIALRAP